MNGAPPSEDELARMLGLDGLHAGRHYLRDAEGARIGSVWVHSAWYAEVKPSFHAPSALCAIFATGEVLYKEMTPGFHKAAFATPFQSAVVDIDRDPVAGALRGFDLFRPDGFISLDGIAYHVAFETLDLRGSLRFSNPSQPDLVALESALRSLASEVARLSGSKELGEAVSIWSEYTGGRQR